MTSRNASSVVRRAWLFVSALNAVGFGHGLARAQVEPAASEPDSSGSGKSSITVYTRYEDALEAAGGKLISIPRPNRAYSGYALRPFRSRQGAVDEAVKKASSSKAPFFFAVVDGEITFPATSPPPGSFAGGVYSVYSLVEAATLDATKESLLAELQLHLWSGSYSPLLSKHLATLLRSAEDERYRGVVPDLKAIIRDDRSERLPREIASRLPEVIGVHEAAAAGDDLLRWSKYHKNAGVRLGAYLTLVKIGRSKDVEEVLKGERDPLVRAAVERKLL